MGDQVRTALEHGGFRFFQEGFRMDFGQGLELTLICERLLWDIHQMNTFHVFTLLLIYILDR